MASSDKAARSFAEVSEALTLAQNEYREALDAHSEVVLWSAAEPGNPDGTEVLSKANARLGSIAKLALRSGRVELHADHPDQSVQRAPFPGRGDSAVRPLVPALSPRLRTRRRTLGGTRRGGGSQLYLALGAGLRTRAQPTLPPT